MHLSPFPRNRVKFSGLLLIVTACLAGIGMAGPAAAQGASLSEGELQALATENFQPFLANYCYACHGNEKKKADLNFEEIVAKGGIRIEDRGLWEDVLDMIELHEMPPERKPQPTPEERETAIRFLDASINAFSCFGPANPGRVTTRRLNRVEYNNTIRDLIGVDFNPAEDFPQDEVGYGFDNIGDVLSVSPLLVEKYLAAAEQITTKAILAEPPIWPPVQRHEAEKMEHKQGEEVRPVQDRFLGFFREAEAESEFTIKHAGNYVLRIRAYEEKAGPGHAELAVKIDGEAVECLEVDSRRPSVFEVPMPFDEGTHRLGLGYTNNYNSQQGEFRGDRNLYVDYVEIKGPLGVPGPPLPESHRRIIPEQPKAGRELASARKFLRDFMTRAYRRPATNDEVRRVVKFVEMVLDDGGAFGEGVQVAVQAILVSPHFLFRWELDDGSGDQLSPSSEAEGKVVASTTGTEPAAGEDSPSRPLNGFEIASRLSYFLWSSMPDDELFRLATSGELVRTEVIESQVVRMLQDPKSRALIENFSGQWLQTRNLETFKPDPERFPEFDDALRAAMQKETELFFAAVVREDRSLLELIDADFTFLNERLARHYGIEGVEGADFQRVNLPAESPRGGVLTHASILTLTSNPTRTSPVIRGKWILEQILGTPPPPPPPNVEELDDSSSASAAASLRERLEAHRAKPECAGCHSKMDPLGFAFENFDAIGRWRDMDGRFPVDASGKLPSGEEFDGAQQLKRILRDRQEFVRNVTEKMLTYALGRGIEYYDRCVVDDVTASLESSGYRFSQLVRQIALSDPFLRRSL